MDRAALESLLDRNEVWLLSVGLIVLLGIAGESYFGFRQWWYNRKLQDLVVEERAKLTRDIADANARAAEAAQQTEMERLERGRLQKLLEIRSFSYEQHQRAVAELSRFAGQSAVLARTDFSNEVRFATVCLLAVLEEAGWSVNVIDEAWRAPLFGILIECDSPDAPDAARALGTVLKESNWEIYGISQTENRQSASTASIRVNIGENRYMER